MLQLITLISLNILKEFVASYLFAEDCSLTIEVADLVVERPILGMNSERSNFHSHSLAAVAMLPSFDSRASCLVRPLAYSFADRSFGRWDLASFLHFNAMQFN